jgi:hypothetical protein
METIVEIFLFNKLLGDFLSRTSPDSQEELSPMRLVVNTRISSPSINVNNAEATAMYWVSRIAIR